MTTLAQTIERTRRHLYSGEVRDARDRLDGALTTGTTDVALEFGNTAVQPGASLAIDLEELYVWRVNDTTAVCSRGDEGSTAAIHADNAIVYVNPKFSTFVISQAINDELGALSADGLYRVGNVDIPYDAGTDAYDLTGLTSVIDLIDVEFYANDGSERWLTLPRHLWRLRRDLPTASFPSGMALTVNGYVESGQTMRVAYKAPYNTVSALTDTLETTAGLHVQAHDIVPFGAAIRLLAGAEVARNFLDQGETRRADEVGPGARNAEIRNLAMMRATRIEAEKARLYAQRPMVRG